jgi:hypothetical protein
MLREALVQYLEDIESAVRELNDVYVEHYEEEHLASDRVNLRIRIRFATGYLLELNEAAILEGENIDLFLRQCLNLGIHYTTKHRCSLVTN